MHSSNDLSSIARKRGLGKKLFPMQQAIIGKKNIKTKAYIVWNFNKNNPYLYSLNAVTY